MTVRCQAYYLPFECIELEGTYCSLNLSVCTCMHELVYKVDAAYREIEHGMCTSGGYHRKTNQ